MDLLNKRKFLFFFNLLPALTGALSIGDCDKRAGCYKLSGVSVSYAINGGLLISLTIFGNSSSRQII